jgi:hypothetical protein
MIVDPSNRENVEGWRDRDMGIRTLLKRIEQAEKALQARSVFSADCICFPEDEPPFLCFPSEEEIAARVNCPCTAIASGSLYFTFTLRSGAGRAKKNADNA